MELYAIGNEVARAFQVLIDVAGNQDDRSTEYRQFGIEEQRFRLWSHSLGLFHHGHASLDYRVRDATIFRDRLAEILLGLAEHLLELKSIYREERLPFEDEDIESTDASSDECSESDDSLAGCGSDGAKSSDNEMIPIREVDFRLQSIRESINALYSLAAKIRHPRNRTQRTLAHLFKHVPADDLMQYIHEREIVEASIVAYIQHEQLLRTTSTHQELDQELIAEYASPESWMVKRTAVANVRRRQQFVYWREHALRLGQGEQIESKSKRIQVDAKEEVPVRLVETVPYDLTIPGTQKQPQRSEKSFSTYATTLNPDFVGGDRANSEISKVSRVSTAMNLEGDVIEWPLPPDVPESQSFFTCPYCKTLCPRTYLLTDSWRAHLISDLQPYLCTYQECKDPNRLYGSKQEWIAHEDQHTQVWHCWKHQMEFETQLGYIKHLQDYHIDALEQSSPDLVAYALGPSEISHRTCPFCPVDPSEVENMQKHIIFHLQRLAVLALPDLDDETVHSSRTKEQGQSLASRYVQRRGRQESVAKDFSDLEFETSSTVHVQDHGAALKNQDSRLTEEALRKTAYSQGAIPIRTWAQNLPTEVIESKHEHSVYDSESIMERPASQHMINPTSAESRRRQEIHVAIICALSWEADAVEVLCDKMYDIHDYGKAPGDANIYNVVQMGRHKVVILYMPAMGKSNAAASGMNCLHSFPNIRLALLTGICGGIPSPYTNAEILLGDVIVSDRLVPYDFGRRFPGGFTRKDTIFDNARKPLPYIAAFLSKLKTRVGSDRLCTSMANHLSWLRNESRHGQWATHPGISLDVSFEATYHHKHHNRKCEECETSTRSACADARETHCELLGCDRQRTISRKRHQTALHNNPGGNRLVEPFIHFGAYASGDIVMKSGEDRDEIGQREKVIAFEMEGAGIWDNVPTIIVKGVCDYADSHKNKVWQKYAATTAAACVKALLEDWPTQPQDYPDMAVALS